MVEVQCDLIKCCQVSDFKDYLLPIAPFWHVNSCLCIWTHLACCCLSSSSSPSFHFFWHYSWRLCIRGTLRLTLCQYIITWVWTVRPWVRNLSCFTIHLFIFLLIYISNVFSTQKFKSINTFSILLFENPAFTSRR